MSQSYTTEFMVKLVVAYDLRLDQMLRKRTLVGESNIHRKCLNFCVKGRLSFISYRGLNINSNGCFHTFGLV